MEEITQLNTVDERGWTMNWDQIEGNWKQVKGKFREKWGKLTDDDLDVVAGKRDQLLGKLQEKYGPNVRKKRRNWMNLTKF